VSRDDKYSEDRPRAAFGGSDARWIGFALKRWLHLWERDLAARPTAVAAGVLGQQEAAKHSQTRQYLRPLFAGLKKRTLESDIVEMVAKILGLAQEREYLKAHEEYLVLSIGNAAWPMGVANVGIHARAGRERLASNQTAHVMNDETKRKYIQALKRLLTYAQDKCPTVPSKMFVL
jgi:pre-mRNA-splicing factor 18